MIIMIMMFLTLCLTLLTKKALDLLVLEDNPMLSIHLTAGPSLL